MKKILLSLFIFLSYCIYSQSKDVIYYDKDWKETSKENAAFFRPLPMNVVGKYQLIRDYFIKGNLQMQGYSLKNNEKELIGDVSYYDEFNQESISSENNIEGLNGTFSYYYFDGKLWKTTTYKNGKLNGKTTYFFNDGTIMLDGLFENGNCISGSFSIDTKLNSDFRLKKGEPEKQITKVLYWDNSKQIAQKQIILLKKYDKKLIGQQNFDKNGKLIQKLTETAFPSEHYYDEGISDGIKFDYYTRQGCAINVKSENHYSNDKKNGVSINYDISGKIINKVIFKNDLPVNGLFVNKLNSNLIVTSNYKNSLKEGEEIAKTDKDSIIAKGIYKDGKPFNGQFVTPKIEGDEDENFLRNYINFEQVGLQQVFDAYNKVFESYFLKNGMKEGIVATIIDDIKSEVEYKNNLPYDGILKSKNHETIYKNGFLVSSTYVRDYNPEQILEKKEYEKGKIAKVISSQFNISVNLEKDQYDYLAFDKNNAEEDQFQGFVGFYKNEKPFSGFFENENNEFKIVDFYENGVLKYQYSKDWFSTLSESGNQNTELSQKATFKDGKIIDGNEYINYGKIIAIKKYENNILKTLDVNFFEMHYYNKLHYEIKNDAIEITDFQYPDIKMLINFKNYLMYPRIFIENKEMNASGSSIININDSLVANSYVNYMQGENEIITMQQSSIETFDEGIQKFGSSLIIKGYTSIPTESKSKNVQDLLTEIGDKFVKEEDDVKETLFNDNSDNEKSYKVIAVLLVDKNGKPENGIWIIKNTDNSFLMRFYKNSKLLKSKDKVTFKNCYIESEKLQK